jgi:Na+/H+ antiporter
MSPTVEFEFILFLMAAILALALVARCLPVPPAAAFILGGSALAVIPGVPVLQLDPELVIVLFLPPLLMGGGWFTVWSEFRENLLGILMLAIGAVVFTTLVVGLATHWLVPSLPWAVCFALGAIVSPPDAVAAEAVLEKLNLPGRVTALLAGESLLNDAAGLVLFRFAVAAALTGTFSLGAATMTFGLLAVGGVVVGAVVGTVGVFTLRYLPDTRLVILVSLLLPWTGYIGGEWLHVSGVLATVTCGIILGWYQHEFMTAATRMKATAFWDIFKFLLESLVFILIGLSLHGVLERLASTTDAATLLLAAVLVIVAVVILTRFVWIFASDLMLRVIRRMGVCRDISPSFAAAAVMSWAGMRGVVSLAAALSLPEGLPGRDLVLAATFAVILVTVLVQGSTLGPLVRWLRLDAGNTLNARHLSEEIAFARMAQIQLDYISASSRQPDGTERHPRLLAEYTARARGSANYASNLEKYRPEAVLHFTVVLQAIKAGRVAVLRMHRAGEIHDRVLRSLEQELDLQELAAEWARE